MNGEEIEQVLEFTKAVLERRYSRSDKRRELFSAAKLKVDSVALAEVIEEFGSMLAGKHSEAAWGDFLRKNLFLVESRYVHSIDQLNVVLGGTRKVDFGLVESDGFLDLFEIKLPDTKLLATKQDRGNHFWHADSVKAIVQAEKYLHNAERRAANLAEDIRRERKLDVRVVRPRAVVIMGSSAQLGTAEKVDDFRVLRRSLKNVEIILYDELLARLKNQRGKIYID